MHYRFVLAVACALALGSCENRPPLAPSADETAFGLTAFSVLSGSYNLTATATAPTAVALTWEDNSSHEAGFEIYRSTTGPTGQFALYAITGANVTSDYDFSVPQSTLYCYRVRAFRQVGRKATYAAFSNTACAKTPALPPSNLNATPASSSGIDISWSDNAPTDDTFRIERSSTSAGPWELAATTSSQTSYRDAPRTADQQVCYRAIAVTADGDSGPSNVDCTAPPAGPTNLTAVAASQTIDLSWTDNSAVEVGYEVERSDDGVTFHSHARLPANVTRFSDYRPSSNTTYWYRVRALKDGGFSDLSNVASAVRTCVPSSSSESVCDDGADDDCDDMIDWDDPDCGVPPCEWVYCSPGYTYSCYDGMCYPHCGNGVQDGDESDVDCGGSCASCQNGQYCWSSNDCASGLCLNSVCQPSGGTP